MYYPKPSVSLASLKLLSTGIAASIFADAQYKALVQIFSFGFGEIQGYIELPVSREPSNGYPITPQVVINLHEQVESLLRNESWFT
jgi:hypothetical protein